MDVGGSLNVAGNVRAKQATRAGECVVLGDDGMIPSSMIPVSSGGGSSGSNTGASAGLVEQGGVSGTGFGLLFDKELFLTNPSACVTYTGACAGFTPVFNSSLTLARATNEGDWGFDRETGMDCMGMFYATFQSGSSGQYLHQLLDPYDLSQYIALWDDDSKSWDYGETGSSSVASENTMLCIPTIYRSGSNDGLIHSLDPQDGTAYAHTIGGRTYRYLGIGVYLGYNDSSVLKSVSGVTSSVSTTAANFRAYAQANTVRDGWAGVWNFHQWELIKEMDYYRIKGFNLQDRLAYGRNTTDTTGGCDTLGPFAGKASSGSEYTYDKCLIEDMWSYQRYQFVDDCYYAEGGLAVGQNASPTSDAEDKVVVKYVGGGYGSELKCSDIGWGLPIAVDGSASMGLCDQQNQLTSSAPFLVVGGVSASSAYPDSYGGPGCMRDWNGSSGTGCGARLAFTFDP